MTERSSDKLRICVFSDERSIHTKRWVRGLRGLGHKVDLITFIKDDTDDIGGISLNAGSKLSYLTKVFKLRKIVKSLKPDIFHVHYASSFGFLGSFIRHPRKILSVWGSDVVEFPAKSFIYRMIIVRALSGYHIITATSEFLKNRALHYSKKDTYVRVVPFGVDIDLFTQKSRKENNSTRIGIAKSLNFKYGHGVLLRALRRLVDSGYDVKLEIMGAGADEDQLRSFSRQLRLDGDVEFKGFIKNDNLALLISKLDLFVMPSVCEEGFGVAAIEASACGIPVVATRTGGIPEAVIDGETGILVKPDNVDTLADALEKLILDPELRRRMGKAGREFVEKNYRWENNLKSMNNLYLEIMK